MVMSVPISHSITVPLDGAPRGFEHEDTFPPWRAYIPGKVLGVNYYLCQESREHRPNSCF
jgi:hypothetical protein